MFKKGIGGANTKTGLAFEDEKELCSFLKKQENYEIKNMTDIHNLKKIMLLKYFIKENMLLIFLKSMQFMFI